MSLLHPVRLAEFSINFFYSVVKVVKFLMTTFARCSNDYLFYGRGLGCNMLLPPPHPYRFIIKLLSLYNMLIFIFLLIQRKLEKTLSECKGVLHFFLYSSYLILPQTFRGKIYSFFHYFSQQKGKAVLVDFSTNFIIALSIFICLAQTHTIFKCMS